MRDIGRKRGASAGCLMENSGWFVVICWCKGDPLDSEYVSPSTPCAGEDSATDDRVSVSRRLLTAVWQTGAGAAKSVRLDRIAEPLEYRAKRDDWRRQLGVGRCDRSVFTAGNQLDTV